MSGKTTPLYVICSPRRCGGKTLVSRLLTELYLLGDRPVAAFDLDDEGPQLASYLPQFTTIVDINDISGQIAFFERVLAENEGAKIIDVSHRTFKTFFTIAHQINLFGEARRRRIAPLVLFIVDDNPKSPDAYASIRDRFTEASILPVRNMAESTAIAICEATTKTRTRPALLEVPLLSFSLRALIDRQDFLFSEFWRARLETLPVALDDELRDWLECVFLQLRNLEPVLGCEDTSTWITALASRHPRATDRTRQRDAQPSGGDSRRDVEPAAITTLHTNDVPEAILKFAPKKMRSALMDQSGNVPATTLQKVGRQLQTAEDRIDQLETEIKQWQDRAVLAEMRLHLVEELIRKEIERARADQVPHEPTNAFPRSPPPRKRCE